MTASRKKKPKPIDFMDVDELDRFAVELLTEAVKEARRLRSVGRWKRSKYTDAICNAGPGWRPGMPLVGRNGQTLAL